MISDGFPDFFGSGIRGLSYSNFLAFTAYDATAIEGIWDRSIGDYCGSHSIQMQWGTLTMRIWVEASGGSFIGSSK